MYITEETDCCGIEFICDWRLPSYGENKAKFVERMEKSLDDRLKEYESDCEEDNRGGCGIFLVALNNHQYPVYKDFLRRRKFGVLKTFFNPNTSNTITLLGRLRHQPRKKK